MANPEGPVMSTSFNRRGLLRGLIAGLLGWSAAGAAAAPPQPAAPPRCPHYCDGLLWRPCPGPAAYHVRDEAGCPFCRPGGLARCRVTTYVYDASRPLVTVTDPIPVTASVYDPDRPPVTDPAHVTTSVYDLGRPRG
jgi:hypothetical protein